MARPLRVDEEGAWHHVMNRGARRSAVFDDDEASGLFVQFLGETALRFELEVHAYCVMPNHYHLLVRSVRGNLSRAMRHLGAVFTQDANRRRGWDGPVFRGRFKSQVIKDESHLLTVAAYIHMNPVRARIVRRLDQRAWTSHRGYLGLDVPPSWLHREAVWAVAGGQESFARYVTGLRIGRLSWPEAIELEAGWLKAREDTIVPRPELRDGVLPEPMLSGDDALAMVTRVTGVSRNELLKPKRGRTANPARRFAVWALANGTTMTQAGIGGVLGMAGAHVGVTLGRMGRTPREPIRGWIDAWDRLRCQGAEG